MLELNTKDALHDGELRLRPTTDPGVGDANFGGADRIPIIPSVVISGVVRKCG